MNIKHEIKDDILTIELEGKIDSTNANDYEKEILNICESNNFEKIIINLDKLEYTSSAGLRLFLKIKKQYDNLMIVEVSKDVYEVFDMSGFNQMIDIKKALRKISVEGCDVIAQGGNGKVYRLDIDTIVKEFLSNIDYEEVDHERALAKEMFALGIPTAIPFDVVKIDDHLGLVFEMLKAKSLGTLMHEDSNAYDKYINEYANIYKKLHTTKAENSIIPKTKDVYREWTQKAYWLTDEEKSILINFINEMPDRDTIVHGDYHTQNLMVQDDEVLLIDMANITIGHPIFDYTVSFFTHIMNGRRHPESVIAHLGIDAETAIKVWDKLLELNLNGHSEEELNELEELLLDMNRFNLLYVTYYFHSMPKEAMEGFLIDARNNFFPRINDVLEKLKKYDYLF